VRKIRNLAVNETKVSVMQESKGKTGLPLQKFTSPFLRKMYNGINQKAVFHLHPNPNLRKFVVNRKQPIRLTGS